MSKDIKNLLVVVSLGGSVPVLVAGLMAGSGWVCATAVLAFFALYGFCLVVAKLPQDEHSSKMNDMYTSAYMNAQANARAFKDIINHK